MFFFLFVFRSRIGYICIRLEDRAFSIVERAMRFAVQLGEQAQGPEGTVRGGGYSGREKFGLVEERPGCCQLHGHVHVYARPWKEKARQESRHRVQSREYSLHRCTLSRLFLFY